MIHCDIKLCVGCRMCEVACSAGHFGAVSPALARIRVAKMDETGIDLAVACFSCNEKPCLECPTEALSVGDRGEIVLDPDFCDACGLCADACPVGAVGFYDEPLFCDLCDGDPTCVKVCPSGALSYKVGEKVSLAPFLDVQGSPAQRRVHFASVVAEPLRQGWAEGRRVGLMSIYQGTSLRVDLTTHEMSRGSTPENGIGGRTWNSVTLLRELDAGIDPLGPENLLCISVGPLTGTEFAATCRFIASAKSPLTGFLGDSGARGFFAPELRWAGVDQIVFSGASETWKYLYIDNDQIELRDASHLVGMDITDTTVQLMDELGDPDLQVATIGPAGENLVKYAIISCNMARACGRTGMGAVMGSKKLKAIVVRGNKPARPADPDRFKKACSDLITNIEAHRQFRSRQLYGTTRIMDALADYGVLPAYHYRSAVFEDLEKVSSDALRRDHVVKGKACYNCNVYCSRYNYTSYSEGEGPEYEAQAAFTVKVGGTDLELAVHVSNLVNRLGLDCISTGEVIAWLMECRHEGIISDEDCDGIDLSWGSKEALLKLPEKIAHREGIGDLLSEGTKRVAEKFGAEAKKLTAEVKGLELFCADPRGIKGYGLMNAVNSRGGDHYRGEPMIELTGDEELAMRRVGNPQAAHRLSEEGKGALVNYAEHMGLLSDSMTICKNISCCMDVVDFDLAADAYSGFLGGDITKDDLWKVCSHVSQVERDFNLREGLRKEDDTLPERFVGHPIPDGPAQGTTINIDKLVDDYYDVKGWEK